MLELLSKRDILNYVSKIHSVCEDNNLKWMDRKAKYSNSVYVYVYKYNRLRCIIRVSDHRPQPSNNGRLFDISIHTTDKQILFNVEGLIKRKISK